jgi:hypothetical protein
MLSNKRDTSIYIYDRKREINVDLNTDPNSNAAEIYFRATGSLMKYYLVFDTQFKILSEYDVPIPIQQFIISPAPLSITTTIIPTTTTTIPTTTIIIPTTTAKISTTTTIIPTTTTKNPTTTTKNPTTTTIIPTTTTKNPTTTTKTFGLSNIAIISISGLLLFIIVAVIIYFKLR